MALPLVHLDRPTLHFLKVRGFSALHGKPAAGCIGSLDLSSSPGKQQTRFVSQRSSFFGKARLSKSHPNGPARRIPKQVAKQTQSPSEARSPHSIYTQEEIDRQRPQATSDSQPRAEASQPPQESLADALASKTPADNDLIAPVHIPYDPDGVLQPGHPAASILNQSGIVIKRQIELANVLIGYEQANRYDILSPTGEQIGYLAEEEGSFAKNMGRQLMATHRPFRTHVFDKHGTEVLRFDRPFSAIKSRIRIYDAVTPPSSEFDSATASVPAEDAYPDASRSSTQVIQADESGRRVSGLQMTDMQIIGEAHSQWDAVRRKYNLYLARELSDSQTISNEAPPDDLSAAQQLQSRKEESFAQFAYVSEPMLSWSFSMKDADDKVIGSIDRNWGGLGREFFTDTGAYVLRMDAVATQDLTSIPDGSNGASQSVALERVVSTSGMTLDQRAVLLATAVTIDYDYFSRHSSVAHGGFMPLWLPMGGGGGAAAEGAAVGGAVGAGEGAIGTGIGMAGRSAGSIGAGEGAIAGAGTMAGYEAMRGSSSSTPSDPSAADAGYEGFPPPSEGSSPAGTDGADGDVWGSDVDPWSESSSGTGGGEGSGGDGGSGGGGFIDSLTDFFF